MVHEDDRARLAQVVGRAEADDAAFALRQTVDERASSPVERHFRAVACEEVLPEILAEALEEEAQPADDREVAQHRVLLLGDVVDDEHDQPADQHDPQYRADAVGHYAQHAVHHSASDALESPHEFRATID
jgi:hypothetical protein